MYHFESLCPSALVFQILRQSQLCADQFESSTPPSATPRATPRAFELLKIGLFKFPPLGTKKPVQMPHQLVLNYLSSKTNFVFNQTLYTLFRERYAVTDAFKLLLKTLLKELFTNKGEILSCKTVKPCKNRKNSREYYVRTSNKPGSNSPPFQCNVQIPPSPGMLKFRTDRRIS